MAKKKEKKYRPISLISVVITAVLVIIYALNGSSVFDRLREAKSGDYPMTVTFIDVGQGDCSLIECGDTVILIDGGESEYAGTVNSYLSVKGISEIDCYIFTHPHSDHIGAAPGIMRVNDINQVMMTTFSEINIPTTNTYEKLLDAVLEEDCDVLYVSAGESYTYGDLTLDILSPSAQTDEYNDMSVVVKLTYEDTSFLFTGDATQTVEKEMLNEYDLNADVLKVGHHGSYTSTSEEFLSEVSPLLAVISCGADNSYGHPHKDVVDLLEEYEVNIRRTDKQGNVVVYSNGNNIYTDGIEE